MDEEKIGQVVNNLLGNAAKYAPPRGIIRIDIRKKETRYLEVEVYNNGPGIPKEKQKLLFDRYSQLDSIQREKSTGLGLVIAKMIIESHNGYIGYRDRENESGCIFYFGLPLNGASTN
jgi:signal transduction histidine kinase